MKEADNILTNVVLDVSKVVQEMGGEVQKVIGKDKFMQKPQTPYGKRKEFDTMGRTEVIQQLAAGQDPKELVSYGIRHLKGRK